MKLTPIEQVAILITAAILAFLTGYYYRGTQLRGQILVETQTASDVAAPTATPRVSRLPAQSIGEGESPEETTPVYQEASEAEPPQEAEPSQEVEDGPLDLNTATLEDLDALPGIGPVLAQRILDYREEHGGFRSKEEIINVTGIGEKTYEKLISLVEVGE